MPNKRLNSNSDTPIEKKTRQHSTDSPVFKMEDTENPGTGLETNQDSLAIIIKQLKCLPDICSDIKEIKSTIGDLKESIQSTQLDVDEIKEKMSTQDKKIEKLEWKVEELNDLKIENKRLREDLEALEGYGRRENLLFLNVEESIGEDCKEVLNKFLVNKGLKAAEDNIRYQRVHRLGPVKEKEKSRPIIARFAYFPDREMIWGQKLKLKGTKYLIKEDFPLATERKRRSLFPVLKRAKDLQKKATMRGDKLIIESKIYTIDTVGAIAETLQMRETSERQLGHQYLFAGQYSPFSNFAKSPFTLHGLTYSSNEQYYQSEKAKFAGDCTRFKSIMSAQLPSEMKAIGDQIQVDKARWAEASKLVMEQGVTAKFSQNKALKDILIGTGSLQLVECTRDSRWGNGAAWGSPAAQDPTGWKGQNLLGAILSSVRDSLR